LAPPSRVTQGLHWELRTVAEHGQLDKALVVVPPVPAEQLQARWRALGAACAGLWPFTVARPLADPRALVLAFRHGRWDVATADTRTEWSYAAALDRVLGGPRPPTPPAPRGARSARGGPGGGRRARAGRAVGPADAAGRGADRDGGRRHGRRGHLVRRESGADSPDGGHQAFRPALAGTVQPVPTGRLDVIIADTDRGPAPPPADIGAAVLDPADIGAAVLDPAGHCA